MLSILTTLARIMRNESILAAAIAAISTITTGTACGTVLTGTVAHDTAVSHNGQSDSGIVEVVNGTTTESCRFDAGTAGVGNKATTVEC